MSSFSVVHSVKFAITEISRKQDCPSIVFTFASSKSGTVCPMKSGTIGRFVILLITNTIIDNLGKLRNVYALFTMHAPIIRMVSSCIVAVTVFWCSLTESNHVLIFTFVNHTFTFVNHTRLYFTLNQSFQVSSSETSIIPHDPHIGSY